MSECPPPLLHPRRLGTDADVEAAGGPVPYLREEILWAIGNQISHAPRSLQRVLGPSEMGTPCDRRLGYKVAGVEAVNVGKPAWKPWLGTAGHSALEQLMQWLNGYLLNGYPEDGPRFLLERRVEVGEVAGEAISGTCDAYDRLNRTVIDWKFTGAAQLKRYRNDGPGRQYRTQAHLYGRGWERRGVPVDHVAVMFLPRDRELRDAVWWHEPYDEQVALAALERAEGITTLIRAAGPAALPLLQTGDAYCTYCPYFLPASTVAEEACPGHPGAVGYIR